MSNTGVLNVMIRDDIGTQASKRLRETGYLPGNIYGRDMDSIAVSIRQDELRKNIAKHGRSAVFELLLDGDKKYNVMIKDIQFTHVKQDLMHVDFHSISLSEETKANVPVRVVGDELFEQQRLVMQLHRDILPLKGLPQEIPNFIEINVEGLNPGDSIFMNDVKLPPGISSELDETQIVLSVAEAQIHEEATEEVDEDEDALAVETSDEETSEEEE